MPRKILIVDDEEDARMLLHSLLTDVGIAKDFHIYEANNVREAIDLLNEKKFDLIISDYRMPGQSGTDLLEHMEENDIDTPFILLTGVAGIKNLIKDTFMRPYPIIQKSSDEEVLINTINSTIRG